MKNRLLAMLLLGFCTIAYAEPDFLVDADWLADRIEDENLVVLEVRYHPHRYYTVGHIPGAVQRPRRCASPRTRYFRSASAPGA